ncbi:MAG: hypothetical protein KIT34_07915 [Cyanobacteria bacterium TGS_CYA1]|nr:hypothetical protein [Cyanobacteria bacterium TGS_CYA1]
MSQTGESPGPEICDAGGNATDGTANSTGFEMYTSMPDPSTFARPQECVTKGVLPNVGFVQTGSELTDLARNVDTLPVIPVSDRAETAEPADRTETAEPPDADSALRQRMSRLQGLYGITFTAPGEKIGTRTNSDGSTEDIKSRMPTNAELDALEAGLSRSRPGQLTLPGRQSRMEIQFADKDLREPQDGHEQTVAEHEQDSEGGRRIIIYPGFEKLSPAMQIETIKHETTHNTQANVYGVDGIPESVANSMGWDKLDVAHTGKPGELYTPWGLRTQDNKMYTRAVDESGNLTDWYRVNKNGQFLDSEGKVVQDRSQAHSMTNEQMREAAKVKPSSDYFDTPTEMEAEALAQFRGGSQARLDLLQNNREMYFRAKELDQKEIDLRYGPGVMKRNFDGKLVPQA